MQTKTDLGTVKLLEIPDSLKERNRTKEAGRELTTAYRVVVSFQSDELSQKEQELLATIKNENVRNKMKETMLKNRTEVRYSGVFNAEDVVTKADGTPFKTPEDGLTNEQQDDLLKHIVAAYKDMNNQNIFTVITFSISELLNDVEEYKDLTYLLYEDASGRVSKITEQSRLFFGFFADTETAKNMIRRSLINRIENDDLEVPTNDTKATKADATKAETTTKSNKLKDLL